MVKFWNFFFNNFKVKSWKLWSSTPIDIPGGFLIHIRAWNLYRLLHWVQVTWMVNFNEISVNRSRFYHWDERVGSKPAETLCMQCKSKAKLSPFDDLVSDFAFWKYRRSFSESSKTSIPSSVWSVSNRSSLSLFTQPLQGFPFSIHFQLQDWENWTSIFVLLWITIWSYF